MLIAVCAYSSLGIYVELNQAAGVDVYDFLHLVRGSSSGEETSTACLGAEIENLDLGDEAMRIDLSPVHDSDQPTFEDTNDFDESIQREVGWERDAPQTAELTGCWEQANKAQNTGASTRASDSDWSSWGGGGVGKEGSYSKTGKEYSPSFGEWKSEEPQTSKQSGLSSTWGKKVDHERDSPLAVKTSGKWERATDKAETVETSRIALDSGWSSWGSGLVEKEASFSNRVQEKSPSYGEWGGKEPQSTGKQPGSSPAWMKIDSHEDSPLNAKTSGGWDLTIDKGQNVVAQTAASDSAWWRNNQLVNEDSFAKRVANSCDHGKWGKEKPQDTTKQAGSSSAWGKKFDSDTDSSLITKTSGGWEQAPDKAQNLASHTTASDSTWSSWGGGESGKEERFSKSGRGDAPSYSEWGAKESESTGNLSGSSSTWGKKVLPNEVWSKMDEHNISARVTAPKQWSKREIDTVQGEDILPKRADEGSWKSGGEAVEFENDGEMKKSAGTPSLDNKRGTPSQWGSRKWLKVDANESSRGWGSPTNGEWKNQRNRPAKDADSFTTSGTFTLTRQRMDCFTVEEQDILSDIEQMMQNIRRIIHQTG